MSTNMSSFGIITTRCCREQRQSIHARFCLFMWMYSAFIRSCILSHLLVHFHVQPLFSEGSQFLCVCVVVYVCVSTCGFLPCREEESS